MGESIDDITVKYLAEVLESARRIVRILGVQGDEEAAAKALAVRLGDTVHNFVSGR